MKRFQLIAGVIILAVICSETNLYAQTSTKTEMKMTQTESKSDRQILSELNAQFIKNFLTQDTAAHNKIIHKDFICIEGSGKIVERDEYMKNWATDFDNSGYKTFSYTDEFIRIFGDMALIRSKTVYTKETDGKITEGNSVYTDTYVKANGKWLCIQAQITPVKR